ncbi:YvcK family protein [Candidatus Uhrbacteria bacterium]|nr:YvcK family protein [Candidatus Uhrbacteria bacterium]
MSKPVVVLIGGGVGASTFTKSLKSLPIQLTTIVSAFDDGGSTGAIRRDYRGFALGDFRQCLFASIDLDNTVKKVIDYRFGRGNLFGVNVGNLLLKAFLQCAKSQRHGVLQLHKLLHLPNTVIPVSYDYAKLCARLTNNTVLTDQSQIQSYYSFSQAAIKSLFLSSNAKLSPEARAAMLSADYLMFTPGNFFSSILPNIYVKGFAETWKKSKAKKIFFFNLLAHRGQDSYYTLLDYLDWFGQKLGARPFDMIIANKKIAGSIIRHVQDRFETTKITDADRKKLEELGIALHVADLVSPVIRKQPTNDTVLRAPLRHDIKKIQTFFERHILMKPR